MRFALLEIKLTLVKLLRRFDVKSSPNTQKSVVYKEGLGFRRPKLPIQVTFSPRNFQ